LEAAGTQVECRACGRTLNLLTAEELAAQSKADRVDRPVGDAADVSLAAPPSYRLASPAQIGAAAFLGSPLAGFLLMARNYAKRDRFAACWAMIGVGTLVTAAVVGSGFLLPESNLQVNMIVAVPLWLGTYFVGKVLHAESFAEHENLGGQPASIGTLLGFVLLGIVLTFGPVFAALELYEVGFGDRRYQVNSVEEVYYSHDLTEAEARTLARVLQEHQYFNGVGAKTVRLSKDGTVYVVSCILVSGFDDPQVHDEIRAIARDLSLALGGQRVRTDLCDQWMKPKKSLRADG
jgi:hypothetical protein